MPLLREFLTDGRLGALQLGLAPAEVGSILGEPDDRSVRRRPAMLLRYGALELTFLPDNDANGERLIGISIQLDDPSRQIPAAARPTDWVPSFEAGATEFAHALKAMGIASAQDEGD